MELENMPIYVLYGWSWWTFRKHSIEKGGASGGVKRFGVEGLVEQIGWNK